MRKIIAGHANVIGHLWRVVAIFAISSAQAQQFFGGGAIAFAPEISTVQSGAVSSVTATVSADRKYVTIGMRAQEFAVAGFTGFPVSISLAGRPAAGICRGGHALGPPAVPANAANASAALAEMNSPEEIDRRAVAARSVLSRRGMFLLAVN